ncbi:MAG: DUF1365 domain-containing protein [Chitinophagales bacterium]
MNSALYKCQVMHHRLRPKKHRFVYSLFMFWIDLDELRILSDRLWPFSYNRFNLFGFYDSDHLKQKAQHANSKSAVKERIYQLLRQNNILFLPDKIFLLTHVRVLGYVFNPVSFYFCYDNHQVCKLVVTEVSNTFGEMKIFIVDQISNEKFLQEQMKYFYVSPFSDPDNTFQFRYNVPGEQLRLQINVRNATDTFFYSSLTGVKKALTTRRLFLYFLKFPLITLRIITAIHWQAFKIWMKGVNYHKKKANPDLQRDILNTK